MQEENPYTVTPFVFSDPGGKRWPRLRLVLLIAGVMVFFATILFVQTLFVAPQLNLPISLRQLKGQLKSLQKANAAAEPPANLALWEKFAAARIAARKPSSAPLPPAAHPRKKTQNNEVHLAFYTNGDPYSYNSLEQHASQITHLCPEWMAMTNGVGDLQIDADGRLPKLAASKGIALLPLLTNLVGDTWQPEAVENLAHSSIEIQDRFIQKVITILNDAKAAGVVIDWEQVDPAYKKDITLFLDRFTDALHYDDKQLWLCVQPGQDLDYIDFEKLSDNVDRFVAMLFDETSDIDTPGPLGSRRWFEGWLSVLLDGAETKQWIIALGSYGYDWTSGAKKAELISFPEAMSRASYARVTGVSVAAPEYNPYFDYEDADKDHSVSFLDVATFLNQLRRVRDAKAGGVAIYRLGTEDVAIWDAFNVRRDFKIEDGLRSLLEILKGTDTIADVGEGEIVSVDETQSDGFRSVAVDQDGYVTASYSKFPQFPTLYHQGAGDPHQVALTFDDGPDPRWTPEILEVLKASNVKAAFFLLGANAEKYPGLVRQIVAEGHEIGNHTYYHPNLALCWPEHVRLELNATELLLQSITGRSTTLFRPPYAADTSPSRISELEPLQIAQDLGYLVVLENIDPQDWAQPGTDIILQRIKQQRRDGSIILLHDAGGDRHQTVEALPQVLSYLRTRGDSIVSLSTLLGTSRDALMPPISKTGRSLNNLVSGAGFTVFHAAEEFLWAFMIVATALVVLRTLIVVWLASRFRRQSSGEFGQPVSVIIAAYNEEKVIGETLSSLLATDYSAEMEVLVIDDGSRDQTAAIVEGIAASDSRVRLVRQENRGKARALQRGLGAIRSGIAVFLDADTHCQRDTLRRLVQPFADAGVGAVSGHAKVGNLRTFIAKCQALEYTCGFNLDRRAYTRWNCMTVVPGAISAIRKTAIDDAGGLSVETLAEDTDLTLALHKRGHRIVYAPDAIAWPEAPETVRTLARQRFRWAYGTLQCLWKHRDMVFNWKYRALGWFSLPSIWFFQVILVAITPIVDLFLLGSLPFGAWRAVLPFVIAFLSMDLLLAILACLLERESVLRAWRILPMRLIYRPLLSYVVWQAIFRAVKGALVSWGKLERTASVPVRA